MALDSLLMEERNAGPVNREQDDLRVWFQSNINKRVCNKFVPKKQQVEEEVCKCGHNKVWHTSDAIAGMPDAKHGRWSPDQNTCTEKTDAFGEIDFVGYRQGVRKFVRVDYKTDVNLVLEELIKDKWGLECPKLIISVTGGAKKLKVKGRVKRVIGRGLMKAAESTGAWIITAGMNAGVMKLVGEAIRDNAVARCTKSPMVAIGVASWGCVNNKESLVEAEGSWPALYQTTVDAQKTCPLDPNHSHFILVDDGTQHQFGVEIELRSRLEVAIKKCKGEAASVPVVLVVLEGGHNTLKTVKCAIESGTPAVIVEGSGRAADILAYAYHRSSSAKVELLEGIKKMIEIEFGRGKAEERPKWVRRLEGVKKKIETVFGDDKAEERLTWVRLLEGVRQRIETEFGHDKVEESLKWVCECLEKRDHMTVYRLDASDSMQDIDISILQALLKVNKDQAVDQLKLALAWNRSDVANSEIFQADIVLTQKDLKEVMYLAILDGKHEFVKLLLENGVCIPRFCTEKRLRRLYNELPDNNLAYQLLRRRNPKKKAVSWTLDDVEKLITDLMGDSKHHLYKRKATIRTISKREKHHPARESASHEAAEKDATKKTNEQFSEDPARDLFLWAILTNRREMALIFWEETEERIAAALTAQLLLRNISKKTKDVELRKCLESQACEYEQLAVGILGACFASDEQKVKLLLVRELPGYGHSTCIQLAVEANNKAFIAHAACQELLSSIWMGRLAGDTGLLRMGACILFPPLIFPLIKFDLSDRLKFDNEPAESQKGSDANMEAYSTCSVTLKPEEVHTQPRAIKQMEYFYTSPVVKFTCDSLCYVAFLTLFSIALLTDFKPNIDVKEIILSVWVLSLFLEEVRQILADESGSLSLKLQSYISDFWNILDMITLVLFLVGLILRSIPSSACTECFEYARIILALNLMTFLLRLLHMFSVNKELGPKLVMIGRMMIDLCFFVLILIVFIIAYGLASQAILYPNSPLDFSLLRNVLRKPYWQMYGELFLEEIEGEDDCTNDPLLWQNDTLPRCVANTWFVSSMLAIYILITNILMLNLLIAMFSNTFARVQERSDFHWKFQRLFLTYEYYSRPPLAPPFIILSHLYMLAKLCCRKVTGRKAAERRCFRRTFTTSEVEELVLWEKFNADEFHRQSVMHQGDNLPNKRHEDRVNQTSQDTDEVWEQLRSLPVIDERLDKMERQMQKLIETMDKIKPKS